METVDFAVLSRIKDTIHGLKVAENFHYRLKSIQNQQITHYVYLISNLSPSISNQDCVSLPLFFFFL